jgi:hypothetical protein
MSKINSIANFSTMDNQNVIINNSLNVILYEFNSTFIHILNSKNLPI